MRAAAPAPLCWSAHRSEYKNTAFSQTGYIWPCLMSARMQKLLTAAGRMLLLQLMSAATAHVCPCQSACQF